MTSAEVQTPIVPSHESVSSADQKSVDPVSMMTIRLSAETQQALAKLKDARRTSVNKLVVSKILEVLAQDQGANAQTDAREPTEAERSRFSKDGRPLRIITPRLPLSARNALNARAHDQSLAEGVDVSVNTLALRAIQELLDENKTTAVTTSTESIREAA